MRLNVTCFNIKYSGRESWLLINQGNLHNFAEHGIMDCYNADSAPKQVDLEVWTRDVNDLDQLEKDVKRALEEATRLTVNSFGFKYSERN